MFRRYEPLTPKLRYSTQARKHKPLLRCTESLKRNDIETFCLLMADEHNYRM